MKKKRKFYYYALVFEVEFENDEDIVYFAFSEPYSYGKVLSEIFDKEEQIRPSSQSMISSVPRKVVGQNPQPSNTNVIDRTSTIKDATDKSPIIRTNTLIQPKDVYKDMSNKKEAAAAAAGSATETKAHEAVDPNKIKNGPKPTEGI